VRHKSYLDTLGERRREEIMAFLRDYIATKGYSPSIREISDAVGLRSLSTVHSYLMKLESEGRIKTGNFKARSIVLTDVQSTQSERDRYRHAMESALANPHAWRETLESALSPAPIGVLEAA